MSVLIGTFAVALFNASKDPIASKFAYLYALISVGILVRILLTLRKKYLSIFSSIIHPSSHPIGVWVCPVPTSHHDDPQT
jgi:hypothetical protein